VSSSSTMKDRGIIDTGHDDSSRIHLLCGDPLLSEVSNYLQLSTTAITLELIRAGVVPRASVELADSVAALQAFTRDPSCRTEVALAQGGRATAIAVQRRHQQAAEAHLGARWMPPFAPFAVDLWGRTLDELEHVDPTSSASLVSTSLDWAIRFAVFGRVLERFQLDWVAASAWTAALRALANRMGKSWERYPDPVALLDPRGDRCARKAGAVEISRAHGVAWRDLSQFVACRLATFQADLRFGELSDQGLFRQLDRAGVLQHRVPGVGDIGRAMTEPPASGRRATIRADAIRRLSGAARSRFVCDWDRITDTHTGAYLDLTSPVDPDGRWRAADGSLLPGGHPADPHGPGAPQRTRPRPRRPWPPERRTGTPWLGYVDDEPADQEA
jgi:hypothetical protein